MIARRRERRVIWRNSGKRHFGGIGTMGSYGLALWAMTERRWRWSPRCEDVDFIRRADSTAVA